MCPEFLDLPQLGPFNDLRGILGKPASVRNGNDIKLLQKRYIVVLY